MEYCYIKFIAKNAKSLQRTLIFFSAIRIEKEFERDPNEEKLTELLSEDERSYFWNPTDAEIEEWNELWFSTPVATRGSPEMPIPPWDLESMYDALWKGEYRLISIDARQGHYYLNFEPYAFPYGGTSSMVALLECFGHTVVGIEDGTGYRQYVKPVNVWKPKNS